MDECLVPAAGLSCEMPSSLRDITSAPVRDRNRVRLEPPAWRVSARVNFAVHHAVRLLLVYSNDDSMPYTVCTDTRTRTRTFAEVVQCCVYYIFIHQKMIATKQIRKKLDGVNYCSYIMGLYEMSRVKLGYCQAFKQAGPA